MPFGICLGRAAEKRKADKASEKAAAKAKAKSSSKKPKVTEPSPSSPVKAEGEAEEDWPEDELDGEPVSGDEEFF